MTARLALIVLVVALFAGQKNPGQLYGRWRVNAVSGASPVTAMSGKAAARLVGRFLILEPHRVQFAGQTCKPTYDVSHESAPEFVQDYKIELKTLDLPDPVTRFDADCTDLFVRDSGKIIFTWKGYFLEASRGIGPP